MSDIINQNTEPLFIFDMPDDETLSETISVKGEKGEKGDPTKLSQLDNDTGFITADTDALTNYYDKTTTDGLLDTKLDKTTFNDYEIPSDFFTADETVSDTGSSVALTNTSAGMLKAIAFYGDMAQDGAPTPSAPVDIETVTGEQTITITGGGTQAYTINLSDIELCKLGNYKDSIFKRDGKWYKHKEINRVVLDGSDDEGWGTSGSTYRPNSVYFTDLADVAATQALSNIFTVWDNMSGGITTNLPNLRFGWGSTGNKLMAVRYDASESLEDFKALLSATPMVVYYELDVPVEEEITDRVLVSQLEAIDRARSYNGSTIVTATGALPAVLYVEGFKNGWSGTIGGISAGLDKKEDEADLINRPYCFDSLSDLQNSTVLADGAYAKTLGYYTLNDGGGAVYFIRRAEELETANGITTYDIENGLIAEIVQDSAEINLKQYGLSENIADNSAILQYAVTNAAKASVILIPKGGEYTCLSSINLGNRAITIKGTSAPDYNKASETALVFPASDGFINARNVTFRSLCIKGNKTNPSNKGITGGACLENCVICYFNNAVACDYQGPSIITNCNFHNNASNAITNPVDSRITNCTINANLGSGINLQAGANDNIISNNKIEWNSEYGISIYNATHNVIVDNVIDRSGKSGLYIGGSQTKHSIFTNNIFRRNGAESTSYDGSNIQINAAYDSNVISDNVTLTGNSRDDGSGTTVPTYGIYIRDTGDHKIYLTNNVLTGGTNANTVGKSSATNIVIIDQSHPTYDAMRIKRESQNAASGASATLTIPFDELPEANNQGLYRKVIATTRNSNDAGFAIKVFYVHFYKQSGNYQVTLSEPSIRSDLAMTASYSAENGVQISVANSHTSATFQIRFDTYAE